MKKILFLFIPLLLIGCGDGDGNGNNDNGDGNNDDGSGNTNVDPNDPIIGTWVLVNEEIVGGDWGDSCRGCFMENDAGSPDTFVFTSSDVTKRVWECRNDGSLCTDLEVYGPGNWENVGSNIYEIEGEPLQVTFIGNNQMQTPFENGDIVQTWERQ